MKALTLLSSLLLSACYQITTTGSHIVRVNTLTGALYMCNSLGGSDTHVAFACQDVVNDAIPAKPLGDEHNR